jgi:hypothetical protein
MQQELEACKSIRTSSHVLGTHYKLLKVHLSLIFTKSILDWIVIPSKDIELGVVLIGLTMSKGHEEEIRFELFHTCSFPQHGWHCLISLWLSDSHFLRVCTITEDIVSFQCLALIRSHIAFNSDFFTFFLLNNYGHVFRNFIAIRMVDHVLLLEPSCISELIGCHEYFILIQSSEHMANPLERK